MVGLEGGLGVLSKLGLFPGASMSPPLALQPPSPGAHPQPHRGGEGPTPLPPCTHTVLRAGSSSSSAPPLAAGGWPLISLMWKVE